MIFEHLYKFQSVSVNSLSALTNQSMWFANQSSFNDPFEGIYCLDESIDENELVTLGANSLVETQGFSYPEALKIASKRYSANPAEFREVVIGFAREINKKSKDYAKNCGVLSLASDISRDSRSQILNMLMWSHYADGLRGYCLKFDAKELFDSCVGLNHDSKFSWAKMDYETKPRQIRLASGANRRNFDYLRALQIKHEQWCYECECRLFSNSVGLKKFSKESLEAVYIGEKMPEKEEILLLDIVKNQYPEAEIYKVIVDSDSFAIRACKKM